METNKPTHTPTPWTVHKIGGDNPKYQVRANADGPFGEDRFSVTLLRKEDADAIAAMPGLLAACVRVLRSIEWSDPLDRMTPKEQADLLRAAIAKTGGL